MCEATHVDDRDYPDAAVSDTVRDLVLPIAGLGLYVYLSAYLNAVPVVRSWLPPTAFLLVALVLRRMRPTRTSWLSLGTWPKCASLVLCICCLVAFWAGNVVSSKNLMTFSGADLFLLIVLAPVGEELFFRGILLDRLVYYSGPVQGMTLATLLFALAHLSLGAFVPMLILGFACALATLLTRTVVWAIGLHVLWNCLSYRVVCPPGGDGLALLAVAFLLSFFIAVGVWFFDSQNLDETCNR